MATDPTGDLALDGQELTLSVHALPDWSVLYENGVSVLQNHRIELRDLVQVADGRPFRLAYVSHDEEGDLAALVTASGEFPESEPVMTAP